MAKKTATPTAGRVEVFARTAPTPEMLAVEFALASLYDPETGKAVASRAVLADMTHYSEKRVRTTIKNMQKAGRWNVVNSGSKARTFIPVV